MTTDCTNPLLVNSDNATVFENTVILCGPDFDSNQLILRSLPLQDNNILEVRGKTLDESCLSSGGPVLLGFRPDISTLTISSGSLHEVCGYSAGTIVSANGVFITLDDPKASGIVLTAAPNQLGDLLYIRDSGCDPLVTIGPSGDMVIYNDLTVLGNLDIGDLATNVTKFTSSGAVPNVELNPIMDILEVDFSLQSGQVRLPDVATIVGDTYDIKNCGTGVFSIEPSGASTIDGKTEITVITQYDAYTLTSDGVDWIII